MIGVAKGGRARLLGRVVTRAGAGRGDREPSPPPPVLPPCVDPAWVYCDNASRTLCPRTRVGRLVGNPPRLERKDGAGGRRAYPRARATPRLSAFPTALRPLLVAPRRHPPARPRLALHVPFPALTPLFVSVGFQRSWPSAASAALVGGQEGGRGTEWGAGLGGRGGGGEVGPLIHGALQNSIDKALMRRGRHPRGYSTLPGGAKTTAMMRCHNLSSLLSQLGSTRCGPPPRCRTKGSGGRRPSYTWRCHASLPQCSLRWRQRQRSDMVLATTPARRKRRPVTYVATMTRWGGVTWPVGRPPPWGERMGASPGRDPLRL